MELCSICHKRIPVVFINKIEGNKTTTEGICLKCAHEMGIPLVEKNIRDMGLTEEDIERMSPEIDPDSLPEGTIIEVEEGQAPAIDLKKLFGSLPFSAFTDLQRRRDSDTRAAGNRDKQSDKQKGSASQTKEPREQKKKYLSQYCTDLTKRAAENKLDKVVGREREIERVIQILCRRQKNNPCLIGEPGVGKTAIAEAIAQKIASGDVPFKLRDKELHLVDMTAIVAGTQFRGQFETRMKGLIDEVKALGNVILVIDEIHSIVGAGDAEGSMNAANILKPALSRGDIQVIGATTLTEYRKYIEKDAALERRFQPVIVEEPSMEHTVTILEGIKKYYEEYHGIRIPAEILDRVVTLSERYITDRFLPDKAIDLLDEAATYRALNSPVIEKLEEAKQALEKLKADEESIASLDESDNTAVEHKYQLLADLKVRKINREKQLEQYEQERRSIELTEEDLAHVIEVWTGIPASNITENEFKRIDRLESQLLERIIGQDEAVSAVVRAIKRSRAGVQYKRKPVSFIFAGPTGVGKTELVKTLASILFDTPDSLIRLDMSEYMEKHTVSRILGSPPGYVGYDDAGQLTEKIRRRPYSVILLDEIEKAHPDVLNILLQILDDGRITDSHGKTVNFENTIIVMTTNAGSNLNLNSLGFATVEQSKLDSQRTEKALSDFLRPEFLNRVDEIITFRQLDEGDFVKIAKLMLDDLAKALSERGIKLGHTDAAAEFIAKSSFSTKYGARNMRRYIQRNVEDAIANIIVSDHNQNISVILIDSDGTELKFDYR
ncbi:MAG: ATP-dependent Clp protease ATP-binding subunit [Eubacteriales bacterium]|jgi:ATP-dependent Clp protease ATP-binding subunit ClpC|nr:ATP-dependent Clp protease ATP-binding subunit [Clostridiales bacterium]